MYMIATTNYRKNIGDDDEWMLAVTAGVGELQAHAPTHGGR
jgi:hypothetical protein